MTTDERQRIARDYRDLAARFRDAAGDERRTREAAAIAARRFITARSDVPAFRELVEWGSGEPAVRWSGTDARAEARWAGRWQGIVQALAAHHPDRLPPMMPGADHYATACDLLADHAEDAGPFIPTPADRNILLALAEATTTLNQVDIEQASGEPTRIVKDRLPELERAKLVRRQHGIRKGYGITQAGLRALRPASAR